MELYYWGCIAKTTMLRVFSLLVAVFLLGGCYTQFKAVKQVGKALAHYPAIVAKIALDSFPCDVIRIDTIISVRDTSVECIPVENFTTLSQIDTIFTTKRIYVKLPIRTTYITKIVESTAKLAIMQASLDSSCKAIRELQKSNDELTLKVKRKNKAIWILIALAFGALLPSVIKLLRSITLY